MNVTLRNGLHKAQKGHFPIINILNDIKGGTYAKQVTEVRIVLHTQGKKMYQTAKLNLPCFTPSGTFTQAYSTKGGTKSPIPPLIDGIIDYNGIVVLDFDDLEALDLFGLAEKVKECAYTFAGFRSPSNDGYKVFVKTSNTDPLQHSAAFKAVSEHYNKITKIQDDKSSSNVNRLCFVSSDVDLFLNEDSEVFEFKKPPKKVENNTDLFTQEDLKGLPPDVAQDLLDYEKKEKSQTETATKPKVVPEQKSKETDGALDYMLKAITRVEKSGVQFVDGSRHHFIKRLAVECYKYGVEKEECSDLLDANFASEDFSSKEVSDIIKWAYTEGKVKEKFGFYLEWAKANGKVKKPKVEAKEAEPKGYTPELYKEKKAEDNVIRLPEADETEIWELDEKVRKEIFYQRKVEETLDDFFDFRINTLKDIAEYKLKDWKKYKEVTKIEYNSISRALKFHGVSCGPAKLETIILSHFSKQVHPVKDMFERWGESLDDADTTDYIKQVADIVQTDAPEGLFYNLFKKWLVASVANVFVEGQCTNHHCPILVGDQGTNKTTFWTSLFPSEYVFIGHLDLTNKDSMIMLTDTFLIVLDEQFAVLTREKDWETLKSAVTMPRVKTRWVYAKSNKLAPRIGNFCGTANRKDILQDDTGNRRFLPFLLTSPIDINAFRKVDITKMWAQAYKLYKANWFYLPTEQEKRHVDLYQANFKKLGNEHYLIQDMYQPCEENDPNIIHFSSTDIWKLLDKEYNLSKEITVSRIGRAMTFLGFEQKNITRPDGKKGRWWLLKRV